MLLAEADPEGLSDALSGSPKPPPFPSPLDGVPPQAPTPRAGASTPNSSLLGGAWGKELRSLTWIPAFTAPPLRHPDGLPWPPQIHVSSGLLAAPSQCCHVGSMWLCSSTTRVSCAEVQSELLKVLLGWSRPVSGRSVALQMLAIEERFEQPHRGQEQRATDRSGSDRSGSDRSDRFAEALHTAFPKLLASLQGALDRESRKEVCLSP